MEELMKNSDIKAAVLISSKPGSFIAGADIAMLNAANSLEEVSCNMQYTCVFFLLQDSNWMAEIWLGYSYMILLAWVEH